MELRRIAILVSQMDDETAEMLLADLPRERQANIRAAVAELSDVGDEELAAVAKELHEVAIANEVDELCGEHGLPLSPVVPLDSVPHVPMSYGGDRLAEVVGASSVERLLSVLQEEYPQTLAAVAAKLSPEDAAKFLNGLSDSVRADVICRVAELGSTDDDVMRELSDEIASRLDAELTRVDGSLAGRDAVKAILFASKGDQRNRLIASLSAGEPRLATQLGVAPDSSSPEQPPLGGETGGETSGGERSSETWTFERVLELGPRTLANVVRSAAFEVVLLALVGASPSQAEHFLAGLSGAESSRFRRRLSAVGPVRLRDIELAQRQLVLVAQRVAAQRSGGDDIQEGAKCAKGLTLSV